MADKKDWLTTGEIVVNSGNVTINGVKVKGKKNTTLIDKSQK